jgi:hypothetical protein
MGCGLQHNARHAGYRLRHPYAFKQCVPYLECFPFKVGRQLRVVQIEIDAIRIVQTVRVVTYLILKIENYGALIC